MRKNALRFGLIVAALLIAFLSVHANLPSVQTGQWAQASNLTQAHDDAASVLLNSGAVLVIGGNDGNGPSTSVERFGTDGSVAQIVPMAEPRQRHTATLLQDGRVLVVGGETASGATNSTEIFDPKSNTWSPAGTMATARSRHTATLLSDGRVLMAGGENNGSPVAVLEIFDPADGSVSAVASLNNARSNHAAALLSDGRVLIVGGSTTDSSGNPVALASAEIFDPSTGAVSEAASLNVARMRLTATAVVDGFVVAVGGNDGTNDLASIEVYDPANNAWSASQAQLASPRSQHVATLLPNNNGVLIWGGSSNGAPAQTAEAYRPWRDAVVSAGTLNAAHLLGTGSPLSVEGLYLGAAGSGSAITELYRFATIKTDKLDYSPGTPVVMTGTGFTPGETVQLSLKEDDGDPTTEISVTADSTGKISYQEFAPNVGDVGTHFHLLAVGQSSGLEAQTTFQDGNVNVISAPSGVTFLLNFRKFAGSTCTGSFTAGTPQTVTPLLQGSNVGVGNVNAVALDAPAISDQGGAFQSWAWTGLDKETATLINGGQSVCIVNTDTAKNSSVNSGTFTATYATTASAPTITSVTPASGNLGQTINTVTITGSNLVANTQVNFGTGITIGTVTANATNTQLTFSITISTAAAVGQRDVTITNPGSGGGSASATLTNGFTVNAPTPTISSLSPAATAAGSAQQTLTINGTNYLSSSTVTYNGAAHTPTFVNSGQLTIQLSAADQATVGSYPVVVTNPVNVVSNTVNFNVNNPVPTLSSISPTSGNLGQTLDVTLTGTKFVSGTTVSFSGTGITVNLTTVNNSTSVTANITIANNATTGARNVTVTNPTPGGGTSTLTGAFTVNNPTTTTNVTATSATPTYGQSDTFTATVTSGAGTPTGSVTFYDAAAAATCSTPGISVALGTQTLNASGTAQASTSSLSAGAHTILACYTPTGVFLASNGTASVTVGKATATVTVTGYSVTYDGNEHTATGTVTGVGGVSLTGLDLSGTKHTTAGSYNDGWSFTDTTGNYNNATGSVADSISKANATISVTGYSVTYDGAEHTASATATGVKGESLLSGLNLSGTKHTNAGTWANDAWSFTDATGNYNGQTGSVSDSIAKAKITVTAGSYAGTYDGLSHALSACMISPAFNGGASCTNSPSSAGPGAGSVVVTPSVTADTVNFDVTPVNGSIAIAPASLTITADPQSMSFGGSSPTFTASYNGLVNNETADVITTKPSFVVETNDDPPTIVTDLQSLKAGGYPIVASGAIASNYSISYVNGTLTVNKAQITGNVVVSPEDPKTVAYGQTVTATVYLDQYSLGGIDVLRSHEDPNDSTKQLPPSLTVWLVPANGGPADAVKFGSDTAVATYDNTTNTTGTTKTGWTATITGKAPVPGNYNAVVYGDDPSDHTLSNLHLDDAGYFYTDLADMQYPTLTSKQLDVVKADLTITANSTSKKYGQAVTFDGTEFTTSGLVNSDTVTSVTLKSDGAVATAPVGSSTYAIVASAAQGSGLENYAIKYVDGVLTVNKADAVVKVTPYTLTYDGNAHSAEGTVTGVNNETPAGLDVSSTAHTNAGTYTDNWTFTDPNGNYNSQSGTVQDVIKKADANITVTGYTVTYDGNEHTATSSITGAKGEALTGLDTSKTKHTNAGTFNDGWTFTDTTGNYKDASGSVTDIINKADASITVTGYAVTYDGDPHTAASSVKGVKGEALTGLNVSKTTHTNAGTFNDGWTFTDVTGNYKDASGSVTDIINKADASITVTGYTLTYDGDPHTAASSIKGVKGEALAGLDVAKTTHTNANVYTDQWTFTDTTGNYKDATGSVTDTINKADAVIKVDGYTVTYDGDSHLAKGTATGVKSEALTGLNLSETAHANAGTFNDSWTFTDATGNYKDATGNVSDTINKADATVVVTPYSVTYDGNPHTATATVKGVKGEDLTGIDLKQTTHTNAGAFTDPWTFTDVSGNYKNATGNTSDNIDRADATISVTGYTVTYDGDPHTATGAAKGVKGETLSGLDLSQTTHSKAGSFNDSWIFTDTTGNYKNTTGSVADSISQADAKITVTPYAVTYDGQSHTATGTVIGAKGEAVAGLTLASTTHTLAGSYNDSWTFTDTTGNYKNASGSVNDAIAKAKVSANAGSYTGVYDANAHGVSACTMSGVYTGLLSCANSPASVGPNVSSGAVTPVPSGSDIANFDITNVPGSFSITPAPLTITAKNQSKLLGSTFTLNGSFAAGQFTVVGLKGSTDNVSSVSLASAGASASAGVGQYSIDPSGAQGTGLTNYNIVYNPGTLSVLYASTGACLGDYGHQILQPVNADGSSTFKQGSTVPAKFRVCDANGNSIGTAGVVSAFRLVQILNGTATPTVDEAVDSTTPDAAFRWDPTAQQWIFNISTKSLSTHATYVYQITLNDGSSITFQYGLPK